MFFVSSYQIGGSRCYFGLINDYIRYYQSRGAGIFTYEEKIYVLSYKQVFYRRESL